MHDIASFQSSVQEARQRAGLSQREFAERIGTSQSAVAKLELGDGNPTVETLSRCAEAAGFALHVALVPLPAADPVIERYKRDVDRTLLRENLSKSVHERLQSLGEWQGDMRTLHTVVKSAKAQRGAIPKRTAVSERRRRA